MQQKNLRVRGITRAIGHGKCHLFLHRIFATTREKSFQKLQAQNAFDPPRFDQPPLILVLLN